MIQTNPKKNKLGLSASNSISLYNLPIYAMIAGIMPNTLETILAGQPQYRLKQIEKAKFDATIDGYSQITTLSLALREQLQEIPWLAVKLHTLEKSKIDNTEKALLQLADGGLIETVLMGRENAKPVNDGGDRYTICVSSQVGCPMACVFCATGLTGFGRNLTVDEIVDQFRFWQRYSQNRISNIVVMGQGEPLLNYANLKEALLIILRNTEIGPTKITVSTCGVPVAMDKILKDKDFPQVRWAVSLHSAIEETRARIMPSHQKGFLKYLPEWANQYHKFIPSRTHFIGLEYLMLKGINDDEKHLLALQKIAAKFPRVRINLIPYNTSDFSVKKGIILEGSTSDKIGFWHDYLIKAGFVCTVRYSQGGDIAAACGQLCNTVDKESDFSKSY
ncbi:MAG: 23S rRNA (adenine(2503)-C(2))-methyltransferase RlmN [Patescibacteria group bacterium]